jgi:hypothetical protein
LTLIISIDVYDMLNISMYLCQLFYNNLIQINKRLNK